MKMIRIVALLLLFAFGTTTLAAQVRVQNRSARAQEDTYQGRRWWYGAYFNVNFSARQTTSVFSAGLNPMLGYKVTPFLSVGPRVICNYTNIRFGDGFGNKIDSKGTIDYGLMAFVRGDIYSGVFVQGEAGYENVARFSLTSSEILVDRLSGLNSYVGLGYNGRTGMTSFEIMLAYDLQLFNKGFLTPINYRVGFTVFY